MKNNISNIHKQCAQVLVKANYEGATDISHEYDTWSLFGPGAELDNIWIKVEPFGDSGESYRQSDAIINYFATHTENGYGYSTWFKSRSAVKETVGDIRKYQLDRILWCLKETKKESYCLDIVT